MLRYVGTSVRGPSHTRDGLPCQDAWFVTTGDADSGLAVVCDGVGSKSQSRQGAVAATRAARHAWALWHECPRATPEDFIRFVEVSWRLSLRTIDPSDASTTCLVAALRSGGSGFVAQLGDGLVGVREPDGTFTALAGRSGSFGALDAALGAAHRLADWVVRPIEALPRGAAVVLASDGVSEDLVDERRGELVAWIVTDIGTRRNANRALRNELRRWPVPKHQDDKTLVAMWRE